MEADAESPLLQEVLWEGGVGGALWPFQPLGWSYLRPLHVHHQLEVLVMRRASADLRVGAERHRLHAGQAVLIPPFVAHTIERLDADADFWVLQFDARLWAGSAVHENQLLPRGAPVASPGGWIERWPDPPVVELSCAARHHVETLAEAAWWHYLAYHSPTASASGLGPSLLEQARGMLRALILQVLSDVAPLGATAPRRLARRAFDQIVREPRLSRSDLCERLGVSEAHLSRSFPKVFGVSLATQRARLKVASFLEVVSTTSSNLLEACFAAGFGSYSQLSRTFANVSSYSPRGYLLGGGQNAAATIVVGRAF